MTPKLNRTIFRTTATLRVLALHAAYGFFVALLWMLLHQVCHLSTPLAWGATLVVIDFAYVYRNYSAELAK